LNQRSRINAVEGTYRQGRVQLASGVDWPDGTQLLVTPVLPVGLEDTFHGHVIIVGFGLAGRCVADLLDHADIEYTIVEQNPVTVETQRALGRRIVHGCSTDAETLVAAGLNTADILALTIPDEAAVLESIELAKRLHPDIYIIARTNYSSQGMRASQLGADAVVKAEQAVAFQFYERLRNYLAQSAQSTETAQ